MGADDDGQGGHEDEPDGESDNFLHFPASFLPGEYSASRRGMG